MTESLIKSRDRVRDHGEVFTPREIVGDMLDLLPPSVFDLSEERLFLEPTCGNGNFLVAIVERILDRLGDDATDLDKLLMLSRIYGVDIQEDNILEARERMLDLVSFATDRAYLVARVIVESNIVPGNFLEPESILVGQWSVVDGVLLGIRVPLFDGVMSKGEIVR